MSRRGRGEKKGWKEKRGRGEYRSEYLLNHGRYVVLLRSLFNEQFFSWCLQTDSGVVLVEVLVSRSTHSGDRGPREEREERREKELD